MYARKKFCSIAIFSLFFFTCFTLVLVYSYGQEENVLFKAQGLYKQGNFIDAVKVLEAFIEKITGNPNEKKRLAEANYLLAKMYFEVGADRQVEVHLAKALQDDRGIGRDEENEVLKNRIDKLRSSLVFSGPQAGTVKKISAMGVNFEMVWIPAGEFLMGSPNWEQGRQNDEGPQHNVTIRKGFWLGRTEVTQRQWQAVTGSNPSYFHNAGLDAPVEQVSWNECQEFIQNLNAKSGVRFRFPTEAEWEYACRAGGITSIYIGNITILGDYNGPELDAVAWYGGNSGVNYSGGWDSSSWKNKQYNHQRAGTHQVGLKQANTWGLSDMLGNVWEWCQDWYDGYYYQHSPSLDPAGPQAGATRVRRGGSWGSGAQSVRSSSRGDIKPSDRNVNLGFRLAMSNE